MTEREIYLVFALLDGIGPVRFKLLCNYFGSAEKFFHASEKELIASGLNPAKAAHVIQARTAFNPEKELEKLEKEQIWFVGQNDSGYPSQLNDLTDPPIGLFGKGDKKRFTDFLKSPRVAVVGSRKMTAYGKHVTEFLTTNLVHAGVTIISGLMYGVDEEAHRAALRSGGNTIGVWAGGIDTVFSGSRLSLATEIEKSGVIISEFPLGLTPSKGTFPSRNRIVAALSQGVVVIEGAIDSGSLITARLAIDLSREVFAVPGPITNEQSRGPLSLIRDGATIIIESDDILKGIGVMAAASEVRAYIPQNETEKKVIEVLKNQTVHLDELIRLLKLPMATLAATLSYLELCNVVVQDEQGTYSLRM